MARKTTIGDNPLSTLIPQVTGTTATIEMEKQKEGGRAEKVRATFYLPADLLEEVRNAAVQLSGPPTRLTLAVFAENAFRNEIERLQKDYNKGEKFPQRQPGFLHGGRPIGS